MRDESFWKLVKKFEHTSCWVWQGAADRYGYYRDKTRKRWVTHRYAWEQMNGPIPFGMHLHHKCKFGLCVNPDHLILVTQETHPDTGNGLNKAKTHCPKGHEYTPENTRVSRGSRNCIACKKLWHKKHPYIHWERI